MADAKSKTLTLARTEQPASRRASDVEIAEPQRPPVQLGTAAPIVQAAALAEVTHENLGQARSNFEGLNDPSLSATSAVVERHAERGDLVSPGKNADPRAGETSVADYVDHIGESWRQGVVAFMNIARLCADANARLTATQKAELMIRLPFGEATFSKFVQIDSDTRLKAPELQRLLPPHYTTMYAMTLLKDEELSRAITDKVIHPDMSREELLKWRKSQRGLPGKFGAENGAGDPAVASPTIVPKRDGVESGSLPSSSSQRRVEDEQSSAGANCQTASDPDVLPAVAGQPVESPPPTVPLDDEELPAGQDRPPLSPNDQRAFNDLMAAWATFMAAWDVTSSVVRARFEAEVQLTKSSTVTLADHPGERCRGPRGLKVQTH